MNLKKFIDDTNARVPESENTYIGENRLKYCAKHNMPVQTIIKVFGEEKTVNCVCSVCQEEERERERRQKAELERSRVFAGTDLKNCTFENDDNENEKISNALKKYADNFKQFKAEAKGVLLYGGVGTGKTFLAACVANRLIEKGYRVKITAISTLVNEMQESFGNVQRVLDDLVKNEFVFLDDLGAERDTSYMNEQVYNIVNALYLAGVPFFVTTNLTGEQMKKPKSLEYERVFDRIFERCIFIEFKGNSRRRKKLVEEQKKYKDMLGL